jgi:hypothetical protein
MGDAEQRTHRVCRCEHPPDDEDTLGDHQPPPAWSVGSTVGFGQVTEIVDPRIARIVDLDQLHHMRSVSCHRDQLAMSPNHDARHRFGR